MRGDGRALREALATLIIARFRFAVALDDTDWAALRA